MKGREDVIEKIRKLLALSTSSNEHEAALAAARAAELMLQHQLSEAQIETGGDAEPIWSLGLERSGKKIAWKTVLAHGLAEAFGCELRHAAMRYVRTNKQDHVVLTVFGRASDVSALKYLYHYLVNEVDRLSHEMYTAVATLHVMRGQKRPSARSWKTAFRLGAASTIRYRLVAERATKMAQAKADPGMAQALMRLDERALALEEHMATLGTRRSAPIGTTSNADGFDHGRRAGRSVDLGTDKQALTPGVPRLAGKV